MFLGSRGVVALLASGVLFLAGCGSSTEEPGGDEDAASRSTAELTVQDGWVKAADSGMTAAFGTLRNDSDEDILLEGVSSDAAEQGELHVTVDDGSGSMVMQQAEEGFSVPAGGELVLEPGGNHLMLMGLTEELATGTTTKVEVFADDGQEWTFELPVREFSGADESYDPDGEEN